MKRFVLVRLRSAAVLLAVLVVVNFLITHLVPGDPLDALVGEFPAPQAYIDQVRQNYGLDQPLLVQLGHYLVNLVRLDLGFSFGNQRPVLPLILDKAGTTLLLMIPALVIGSLLGVLAGAVAARREGSWRDRGLSSLSLLGDSIPLFWLAQMLIVLFAVQWGILPVQGIRSTGADATGLAGFVDYLHHLVLPCLVLSVVYLAGTARVARASVAAATRHDFGLLALAKGCSPRGVFWRHVVPNSLVPVITVIGYNFGYALTGAILTETVFGWPGLGSLFAGSITKRDYPVLDGIFLLAAICVIVANLLTDLLCALVDPRVALSSGRSSR